MSLVLELINQIPELQLYCSFIPPAAVDGLEGFLPGNPRKFKGLARGLRAFEAEGRRHKEEEIDWKALIFAQMIKMESDAFLHLYEQDTFFRKEDDDDDEIFGGESRVSPWLTAFMEKDKKKGLEAERKRIEKFLDQASVTVSEKRERIIDLCEGWRKSYGITGEHKILYALKLIDQPETLTWAEFDDFWSIWAKKKKLPDLLPWITAHAKKMEQAEPEIVRELMITISQQYSQYLEKAASVPLQKEQEECTEKAREILEFLDLLIGKGLRGIAHENFLTVTCQRKRVRAWLKRPSRVSGRPMRRWGTGTSRAATARKPSSLILRRLRSSPRRSSGM